MGITDTALSNLVESTINRYGPTADEASALRSSTQPGGYLYNLIQQQINGRSASAPLAGAVAVFSSGSFDYDNGPGGAFQEALNIANASGNRAYAINNTEVGAYLSTFDPAPTAAAISPSGTVTAELQQSVSQIVNGAASYNFAAEAPSDSLVIFGSNVNQNSVFLNTEVPAFYTLHSAGSLNGVHSSDIPTAVNFDPAASGNSYGQASSAFTSSMSVIGYDSNTSHWAAITGTHTTSDSVQLVNDLLQVVADNSAVVNSDSAHVGIYGSGDTVHAGYSSILEVGAGVQADTFIVDSGQVHFGSNTGGFGTLAHNIVGSVNTIIGGDVDVIIINGSGNTVNLGNSGYVATLTGSVNNEITATNSVIEVQVGSTVIVRGTLNTLNVGTPSNIGALSNWSGNLTVVQTNPDGSYQHILLSDSQQVWKESRGYLANGTLLDSTKTFLDSTVTTTYYNAAPASSDWLQSTISFDKSGNALSQATTTTEGAEYVTLYSVNGNHSTTSGITFTFTQASDSNVSTAQAALNSSGFSAFNSATWGGAVAIFEASTTSSTTTAGYAPGYTNYSPGYSTAGPMNGVQNIQWVQGINVAMDVNSYSLNAFWGSNATAHAAFASMVGELANVAVDPAVVNLLGGAVDTSAMGQNGIFFDVLGDGVQRETGWLTAGEAFLTLSDHPSSGKDWLSALQLGALDQNHDGRIDASEALMLKVWVPGVGKQPAAVMTLAQAGIASISLDWHSPGSTTASASGFGSTPLGEENHGNWISSTFTLNFSDGRSGSGADIALEAGGAAQQAASVEGALQALTPTVTVAGNAWTLSPFSSVVNQSDLVPVKTVGASTTVLSHLEGGHG